MRDPPDLERCFKLGMHARECGTARADNPYDFGTAEHDEWAAGWSATFDLDEDDDAESMRVRSGATDTGAKWGRDDEPEPGSKPISAPPSRR